VITGKTHFISWSFDVKMDGSCVDRHTDMTTSNHMGPQPPNAPAPMGNIATMGAGMVATQKCPPHKWSRLKDDNTADDRITELENDKGNAGSAYNACLAKKFKGQGKKVDVSLRFKCDDCGEYQECDMLVDGELKEVKAGNQGAKKKQTLNYLDISRELFGGAPVTVFCQSAAKAAKEKPHVEKWGAKVEHKDCP
jgi:hypothetical protein